MKIFAVFLVASLIVLIENSEATSLIEDQVNEIIASLNSLNSTDLSELSSSELLFKVKSIFESIQSLDISEETLKADEEDTFLSVPEIIKKNGYPVEIHNISTEDGYINVAHRIPYGKKCGPAEGKEVFWLQHGLMGDSSNWIISGVDRGLAYVLADACFDVFMGNFRGNTYSRGHVNLTIDDKPEDKATFYSFGWHELGMWDVSSNIDYALEITGSKALYYAGHSMGTTTMWVLLSERPEYNDKIKLMTGLAPVAYFEYMRGLIRHLAPFWKTIEVLLKDIHEILPITSTRKIAQLLCKSNTITQPLCTTLVYFVGGYNPEQLDLELLPIVLGHAPAGSSKYTVIHYAQLIGNESIFTKYDYGEKNQEKYGQDSPPDYDLSNIKAPVALIYGSNDLLTDQQDIQMFAKNLPNVVLNHRVDDSLFGHLDFVWAVDQHKLVNQVILDFINPPPIPTTTLKSAAAISTTSFSLTLQILFVSYSILAFIA